MNKREMNSAAKSEETKIPLPLSIARLIVKMPTVVGFRSAPPVDPSDLEPPMWLALLIILLAAPGLLLIVGTVGYLAFGREKKDDR